MDVVIFDEIEGLTGQPTIEARLKRPIRVSYQPLPHASLCRTLP